MPNDRTIHRSFYLESCDGPPRLATDDRLLPASKSGLDRSTAALARRGRQMALAPVADVLARYGFDPAEELARILTERVVVLDSKGAPVLDASGKPVTKTLLDPADHARLTAELLQYTRPKLKAAEVTVKSADLTPEQIDRRIEALLSRATTQT